MKYLLIKDGQVQNVIEADPEFIPVIKEEWDAIIEHKDQAWIGYTYDGEKFTAPPPPVKSMEQKLAEKKAAIEFGANLMSAFAVSSDDRGLSDADRVVLAERLGTVQGLLQVGSLAAAKKALKELPNDKLLPPQLVAAFVAKIDEYLGAGA